MTGCPTEAGLSDFLAGRLDAPSSAAATEHVEVCSACQSKLEELTARPSLVLNGSTSAESWATRPVADAAGTLLAGRYRLRETLGEGGMGTVWAADQTAPVRRAVAVKVIKAGLDGRAVLRRFEAERQALALMDHPNIARVLDGGETADGRPFFVMELVAGRPLTDYCDAASLDIRGRLQLFAQVCHAVQHAHQKGVVHRDLKPSNILVAAVDGKPVPKVIDFGVAKAVGDKLTDESLATQAGVVVGTLDYMSPEQAAGTAADIDTRSDIYSLGVVLYELLTGQRPLDDRRRRAGLGETLRAIQEEEPAKPSARLAASGAPDARRRAAQLRGELDWVVMKCLEKPRDRRYESAGGLARDVERYLADETVEARPPSAGYRLGKFLRRNKLPAAATGLVAAALVLGMAGTLWQANVARGEAKRADERAEAEKARAEELQQVTDFQAAMLSRIEAADAGVQLADDLRRRFAAALAKRRVPESEQAARAARFADDLKLVNATDAAAAMIDRTVLKPAVDAIATQFQDQPAVDASLRQTLSLIYRRLGLFVAAQALQEHALATRRRVLGDAHPLTLASVVGLGEVLLQQGKFAAAEPLVREALEARRRLLGDDHADTLMSVDNFGYLLQAQGKLKEAEPYWRDVLDRRRRKHGDDHRATLASLNNVGYILQEQGRLAEAEPFYREALQRSRRLLGEEHVDTMQSINNLGKLLHDQKKLAEAEPLYREALEKRRRVLGEEHSGTITVLINMGGLLRDQGKTADAEHHYRLALAAARKTLGPTNPKTLSALSLLGRLLQAQGKPAEAEPLIREAAAVTEAAMGKDHPRTGRARFDLGRFLAAQRKFADAEAELVEAERVLAKAEGAAGTRHKDCVKALADLYEAWNAAEPGDSVAAKAAHWKGELRRLGEPDS